MDVKRKVGIALVGLLSLGVFGGAASAHERRAVRPGARQKCSERRVKQVEHHPLQRGGEPIDLGGEPIGGDRRRILQIGGDRMTLDDDPRTARGGERMEHPEQHLDGGRF